MNGRDANELMSMPVIATSEGKELGRVKDVLFDPEHHALLGVMVSPATGMDSLMFVDKGRIQAIGGDAITVTSAGDLQEVSAQPRAREIVDSGLHLRGTSVVTETGNSLGTVDKILIDDTGNIASYHASSGLMGFGDKRDIMPSEVISIGEDAIVVSSTAEQRHDNAKKEQQQGGTGTSSSGASAYRSDQTSSDETMRRTNP